MIKLVVLDYDGTLVGTSGVVSKKVKNSIQKAIQKGVKVSISSGRSAFSIKPLIKELNLDLPHVFLGGAIVQNPIKQLVLLKEPMKKSSILEAIEFCEKNKIYIEMASQSNFYKGKIDSEFRKSNTHTFESPEEADLVNIAKTQEVLIMRMIVEKTHDDLFVEFQNLMKDQLNFHVGVPFDFPNLEVVNVTDINVSKVSALRHLCEYLRISPNETMAIGDSPIDLPLIENVAIGVAMRNAPKSVQEKAKWVTSSADDDGVATALDKFLP